MVTDRVKTLPTEPTDREIVKSHPLLSFINMVRGVETHI